MPGLGFARRLFRGLLPVLGVALAATSGAATRELTADSPSPHVAAAWRDLGAVGWVGFAAPEHPLAPTVDTPATGGLELEVTLPGGGLVRMLPLSAEGTGPAGRHALPAGAASVSKGQDAEVLTVQDTWKGVDEELRLGDGEVEHVILVGAAALDLTGEGDLEFTWRLILPPKTSAVPEPGEGIVLRDDAGVFLARVPVPIAWDGTGEHADRRPVRMSLSESGELRLVVSGAWLRDPARTLPVRIDPTISLQPVANARTGFVDEIGNRQSGEILSGSLTDLGYGFDNRGYAEFATTAIPDSATVSTVHLRVWLDNHDNPLDPAVPLPMEIKAVPVRASTPVAALHAAIPPLGSGRTYASEVVPRTGSEFCPPSYDFRDYDLGPLAVADLQSQLPLDFLTVGFVSGIVTDPGFDHIDYVGYPETVNNPSCATQSFPGTRITLVVSYEVDPPPTCDAGGPYAGSCAPQPILLDGTGSSDPDGQALTYAWSTTCPGTLQDADRAVARLELANPCAATCTVSLRVSDGVNMVTCTVPVAYADVLPPALSGVPPDASADCGAVPAPASPSATDACDPAPVVTLAETRLDGRCADSYRLVRTWTARDRCGNASQAVQVISVDDTHGPALAGVPADATAECDAVPPPPVVSATDDCDPAPVVTLGETRANGTCPDSYTLTRTWTATDRCGNAASRAQIVTVRDTRAPVIGGVPADVTAECDSVPATAGGVTASDACDPAPRVTFSETRTNGSCADSYTLTRTWTATDRCANASSRSQVVTVRDTRPPVLAGVPSDATVECDAVPAPATPTASDACDPSPRVTLAETRTNGSCADSYTLTRTWTATDRCSNASSRSQIVTVRDTRPPVLAGVPSDATVECDAVPAAAAPTASDACDPSPRVTFSETRANGSCADSYTLTRTWTATDRCANASNRSQVVTVRDTRAPMLAGVPSDATVECDAVPAPATPTASDACDPAPRVTFGETRANGSCADSYTLTRTWTATDRCANASSRTQVVTVRDTRPPVLAGVPSDATVECDAVPAPAMPTASDACDPSPRVTFSEARANGSCADSYTLTRTWTATDRCANASSRTQVVTVRDTRPPTLAGAPSDATVECDAVPVPAMPTASDACDPSPRVTFIETRTNGSCADSYTLTRTWTATDRCSNASSRSQIVTVRDTRAPMLAGVPPDATVECDAVPAPAAPTASDACDPSPRVTFSETRTNGSCADSYTLTRTWTATDRCFNASSRTQVVTVRDTRPPTLVGVPADVTVECDAVPAPATPAARDNCDPSPRVTFSEARADGRCAGEYRLDRTWTATDRCGNAASSRQVVSVVDTTPPVVAPGSGSAACLWPPNHRMACFGHDAFAPTIHDACSEPVTWRFSGCASDQPEDGSGDGHFAPDCAVSDDGSGICVRAERQGTEPDGRHYAVAIIARDACGNESAPTVIGTIMVPHDMSSHPDDCTATTGGAGRRR